MNPLEPQAPINGDALLAVQISPELRAAVRAGKPPETLPFDLVQEFCQISACVWGMKLEELEQIDAEVLEFVRRYANAQRARHRSRLLPELGFRSAARPRDAADPGGEMAPADEFLARGLGSGVEDPAMPIEERAARARCVALLLLEGLFHPTVRRLCWHLRERASSSGDAAAAHLLASLLEAPSAGLRPASRAEAARRIPVLADAVDRLLELWTRRGLTWEEACRLAEQGQGPGAASSLLPSGLPRFWEALTAAAGAHTTQVQATPALVAIILGWPRRSVIRSLGGSSPRR